MQGDRRAGPSFSEFNYESTWGQKALKATYAAIMGVSAAVLIASTERSLLTDLVLQRILVLSFRSLHQAAESISDCIQECHADNNCMH